MFQMIPFFFHAKANNQKNKVKMEKDEVHHDHIDPYSLYWPWLVQKEAYAYDSQSSPILVRLKPHYQTDPSLTIAITLPDNPNQPAWLVCIVCIQLTTYNIQLF